VRRREGYAAAGLLAYAAHAGAGALIGVAAANSRSTILLGQLFYLPSIMLGGMMVPAAALPPVLARVSLLLPASHAMRVFSALGMQPESAPFPWLSVAVLGLLPYVVAVVVG
jgi:ABC-2 type transport system permease protein